MPNSTTGQTPTELFLNRRLRTRLDLMCPDLGRKVFDKQSDQKARHDKVSREREFALGEQVLVQNFQGKPRWLDGTVAEQTGPILFKVLVGDQLWKCHVDQMHQQCGSQIDHAKHNANVSVTPPNVASNQDVVDVPAITSPQSETAEVPKKEPISEHGNDVTAHPTATVQPQAQPCYPT